MRQKGFDFGAAQRPRILAIMEVDEAHDPSNILFFRAITVVPLADLGSDQVEKARFSSMMHNQSASFDDKRPPWSI